ncbi:MAG TPA: lamin tail domain-containing protein [Candidatus Eisenbacteria bacterium]
MTRHALLARAPVVVFATIAAVAGFSPFAPPSRADLVLNEVLYDPAGADEGAEFVELWNPDSTARSLAGVAVEAGDGADPGVWSVVYRGDASGFVAPGSPFLIAGALLTGPLQNGPDAVRLTRDGATIDLLGYGALDTALLSEGAPAVDVASGHSLARIEDGRDEGRNGDDWGDEASPTPGRANHPAARVSLVGGSVDLAPLVPWPGERATVAARVLSRGRLPVDGSRWKLVAERADGIEPPLGGAAVLGETPGVPLAPGESADVRCVFDAPPRGAFRLRVRVGATAPSDPGAADLADTATVLGRTVAGPVVVNEIAFHDQGAGEWIELWVRDPIPDPGAVSIADASSAPRPIVPVASAPPRPLEPGARIVVAEDPSRLIPRFGLDSAAVYAVAGGWPALNDADGPDGFADQVRALVDASPADAVPYDARAAALGRSIERLSPDLPGHNRASWGESVDPAGGTPGRANSLRAPDGTADGRGALLRSSGRVVRPGVAMPPLLLRLTPEARGRTLDVVVRDLLGRPVRTLVRGQRFAGDGAFAWDGRDDAGAPLRPGLYLVCAEAEAEGTDGPRRSTLAVAVAPAGSAR